MLPAGGALAAAGVLLPTCDLAWRESLSAGPPACPSARRSRWRCANARRCSDQRTAELNGEQLECTPYTRRRPRDEEASAAEGPILFQLPVWEPHHLHGFILEDWARQLCRVERSDECDGERAGFQNSATSWMTSFFPQESEQSKVKSCEQLESVHRTLADALGMKKRPQQRARFFFSYPCGNPTTSGHPL